MPNKDNDNGDDEKEQLDIPRWLYWTCTTFGAVITCGVIVAFTLFLLDKENFPSPADLEASSLFGLGMILILIHHIPWQRINLAGIEFERTVEEQAIDLSEEIQRLEKELSECRQSHNGIEPRTQTTIEDQKEKDEDKNLVSDFLSQWDNWGFTVSRIRKWGSKQRNFSKLYNLSDARLRVILANLIAEGKVRTRVSKNGNVLYQAN